MKDIFVYIDELQKRGLYPTTVRFPDGTYFQISEMSIKMPKEMSAPQAKPPVSKEELKIQQEQDWFAASG